MLKYICICKIKSLQIQQHNIVVDQYDLTANIQ